MRFGIPDGDQSNAAGSLCVDMFMRNPLVVTSKSSKDRTFAWRDVYFASVNNAYLKFMSACAWKVGQWVTRSKTNQ